MKVKPKFLFTILLAAALLSGMLLISIINAKAATPIYVRTGGDDTQCNGTVDVDYSAGSVAPNCAAQTIQRGINLVDPGGTINVAAGTYNEVGQIVIYKSLTIAGAGQATTTVRPTADTGNSGDARGWFLVNAGVVFNLNNLTLDGTGYNIYQGIRILGQGTINQVTFTQIKYPGYMGVAVAAMGDGPDYVTNSTFTEIGRVGVIYFFLTVAGSTYDNNTYTGKGLGNWLDYGVELGGGGSATITNSSISNNKGTAISDGSTSAAILATTYFGAGTQGTISGCFLHDNLVGISVGYNNTDTSTIVVTGNSIYSNSISGVSSTNPNVDASGNWWGSNSPAGVKAAANSGTLVDYTPWLDTGTDTDEASAGFQGDLSYLWVDDDSPQTGSTARIQEGINLVTTGGTVHTSNGIYTENVVINKTLTMLGESQAGVIVYPAISAANPCTGSSLCGGAASNIFLVQADDVVIHDLTADGDNPSLKSNIVRGGADLDARNGIINNSPGTYNGLEVYNVTVKNIYLRGIYPLSGGTFNVHHNTVNNVQGDVYSVAIMNWAGTGTFAYNAVSEANDGIATNHSSGTQFLNNTVTNSDSGIHSDNNGDSGGTADIIRGNTVSNCKTNGYGIFVFASRLNNPVSLNTVTNCSVGLAAAGQIGGVPSFTQNTVNGQNLDNSIGIFVTTSLWGWGTSNVTANFSNNFVIDFENAAAFESQPGRALVSTLYDNSFTGITNTMVTSGTIGTFTIDASRNWWGTNNAASVKTLANAGSLIDYTPWLDTGTDTDGATAGFQGDFSGLWVDDDSPQTGATGRIQEGINLVTTGGTARVMPGTYTESPDLNKNATVDVQGALTLNGGLTLSNGAWLAPASGLMKLSGDFPNNGGTFTHRSGTVEFNGSSAQTIGGSASNTFNNLTVNNASGVGLGASQTVEGELSMTSGNLTLGASNLNLGGAASVTGGPFSASKMVVADGGGSVCKTYSSTGSFDYPVGDNTGTAEYSPATVDFTSGSTFLGCLRVTNARHTGLASATNYLARYWTLTSTSTGYTIGATFKYVDAADINGTEASMVPLKYTSGSWTSTNGAVDTGLNTISFTGMTTLSDFTAGDFPTAVTLSGLSTRAVGSLVFVEWSTASELDLLGFNVYRSTSLDGPRQKLNDEMILARSPGSVSGSEYAFEDATAQAGVTYYYWLEGIEINGAITELGPAISFIPFRLFLPITTNH